MLLKEQYTFEVRSSSFTKENKLQSENILYWFQEAASQHSEKFNKRQYYLDGRKK